MWKGSAPRFCHERGSRLLRIPHRVSSDTDSRSPNDCGPSRVFFRRQVPLRRDNSGFRHLPPPHRCHYHPSDRSPVGYAPRKSTPAISMICQRSSGHLQPCILSFRIDRGPSPRSRHRREPTLPRNAGLLPGVLRLDCLWAPGCTFLRHRGSAQQWWSDNRRRLWSRLPPLT